MDSPHLFAHRELSLLRALQEHEVPYLVVGLGAATLQGAPVVTQDIDLWIEDLRDARFQAALESVGAIYVSGFGHSPPAIAGEGFELFDLVLNMSGLPDFRKEFEEALFIEIEGVSVPLLPLSKIITSKKAANRQKDKLVLKVLEDVQKTLQATAGKKSP
ncbi:hypothetical protein MRY87_03415 [bacterium]|nr:hypothetical protein [bacterium]